MEFLEGAFAGQLSFGCGRGGWGRFLFFFLDEAPAFAADLLCIYLYGLPQFEDIYQADVENAQGEGYICEG